MAKWGEGDPRWIVEERPDATNVNNWHWTEKNASEWSRNKFTELLIGLQFKFDGPLSGSIVITEITRSDGDATANNRKAKLIFLFEWDLEMKFEARFDDKKDDDGKITGRIEIPNLSDENSADELDISVKMDSNDDDAHAVKEIVRTKFVSDIKRALGVYIKQLKEEYSKDLILPTKTTTGDHDTPVNEYCAPAKNCISGSISRAKKAEQTDEKKNDVNLKFRTLTMTENFQCSRFDLYNALTVPEMVQAFTRSPGNLDVTVGGSFTVFAGHIEGRYTSLVPNEKIGFTWRMKTWPADHFSIVQLDLREEDGATILHLTQNQVPENHFESTQEGWRRYYFEAIKQTFGFGARLF